jgi:hypothetical protein
LGIILTLSLFLEASMDKDKLIKKLKNKIVKLEIRLFSKDAQIEFLKKRIAFKVGFLVDWIKNLQKRLEERK